MSALNSFSLLNRATEGPATCSSSFSQNRSVSAMYPFQIICFSSGRATSRKSLVSPGPVHGSVIATSTTTMQLTIRTKITYGFLILAFGMMLTDVCKLMRAPLAAELSTSSSTQHLHKF
jgi:hypothetical protein